jgi:hypothetical protein
VSHKYVRSGGLGRRAAVCLRGRAQLLLFFSCNLQPLNWQTKRRELIYTAPKGSPSERMAASKGNKHKSLNSRQTSEPHCYLKEKQAPNDPNTQIGKLTKQII